MAWAKVLVTATVGFRHGGGGTEGAAQGGGERVQGTGKPGEGRERGG